MHEAFVFYFPERDKQYASLIRMEGKIWSTDYEDGEITTKAGFKLDVQKYFIDGRAKKQYNTFNSFFKHKLDHDLL